MSSFDIDLEKLVKEAVVEGFDEDVFIERLSMDINESNPDWWAAKIVEPLREVLKKAILNNKDFIKSVVWEYMDREFYDELKSQLRRILYEQAEAKLKEIMPEIKIEVKNEKRN